MKLLKTVKKFIRHLAVFKKKNPLFVTIVAIVVVFTVFSFVFYARGFSKISSLLNKPDTSITGIILFVGDECQQCDKVETYIKNNKVEEIVSFTRLEVFNNSANANLLEDKSQTCGLDPAEIGVPFLWDGQGCIIGYVDVIEFFRQKISRK